MLFFLKICHHHHYFKRGISKFLVLPRKRDAREKKGSQNHRRRLITKTNTQKKRKEQLKLTTTTRKNALFCISLFLTSSVVFSFGQSVARERISFWEEEEVEEVEPLTSNSSYENEPWCVLLKWCWKLEIDGNNNNNNNNNNVPLIHRGYHRYARHFAF